MRTRAARAIAESRVGFRGVVLLVCGWVAGIYGYALIFPSDVTVTNATFRYFETLLPLNAWGMVWVMVAAICLFHAFMRYDRFGYIAAIGLFMGWGLLSLVGVWFADVGIGSVGIWLGFALFIFFESLRPETVVPLGRGDV